MQTLSTTLAAAIAAGNRQRCLFVFEDGTEFTDEDIVSSRGLQLTMMFNSEKELTIGLCPSAQIRFSLMNDHRQLADFEFGTFTAYLGAKITDGTPASGAVTRTFTENGVSCLYEFAPLGVFIVDRPDVVSKNMIEVSANDRMSLFDTEITATQRTALTSDNGKPTDLYELAEALCGQDFADVTLATTRQQMLNNDLGITLTANQLEGRTLRDVLRWVAEAAGSIAVFNRQGELEIRWFATTTAEYDESKYSELAMSWYETQAITGLKVRNQNNSSETPYGTDFDNSYVISGNPFLR